MTPQETKVQTFGNKIIDTFVWVIIIIMIGIVASWMIKDIISFIRSLI